MEPPRTPATNFFNLLTEEIILIILDHIDDDPLARKSFSQVCKSFYSIESGHRKSLKPRLLEFLPITFSRYPSISHIDFSLCPRVEDDTLSSISLAWKSSLRLINLSGSKFFTHKGLSNLATNCSCLLEIDLSNRTDLTDSALKAVGEANNLEKLWLTRCKSITDMGIGCLAVNCRKLKSICLRWCLHVSDYGVALIAVKCKEIRSLDLSYLPITEKCLSTIFQLDHLEDLVLEHCLGIDDDGLVSLKKCCQSLKMLNLSNCQNISHIGLSSLIKGAQNLEKIVLSYGLSFITDLAKCLHNFPRLQSVNLDGSLVRCSGVIAIGNWHSSLKELSLSKCRLVTDECLSFTVQTHKELRKLDITCCRNITYASMDSITSSCPMLASLRMESCTLVSRDAFLLIGRCQYLEEIDVTDTDIDDKGFIMNLTFTDIYIFHSVNDLRCLICVGLESITRCSKLSFLRLGICLNVTDKGLVYIGRSCSKLTALDLYRCSKITDVGIAAIADGCPSLEVINVAYNTNVTDNSLLSLSKCLKLRILEVRGCPCVSSVGLSAIAVRCRRLSLLDIKRCNNVTDDGMIQLALHTKNLKQVKLSYCSVTDTGLFALASMSCLHHISIYHLENLTSNGLAAFLLTCQSLIKVKLNTSFKSLLPQHIHEYMEVRGCLLVWRDKESQTSRHVNSWE